MDIPEVFRMEDTVCGDKRIIEAKIDKAVVVDHDDVIVISFDIETTGQSFEKNAMVELGAVAFIPGYDEELRTLGTFEGHLAIPEKKGFEKLCEIEFWDVHKVDEKKIVLECTIDPTEVMTRFVEWVKNIQAAFIPNEQFPHHRIRFIGDALFFDAAWVSFYLDKYINHPVLHQFFSTPEKGSFSPLIDTNAYNRGIAMSSVQDELEGSRSEKKWWSSDLAAKLKLKLDTEKKSPIHHDHRAVNDARSIAWKYNYVVQGAKHRIYHKRDKKLLYGK
jgi:DNA polymerase III epsilon subunit-like protein